MTATGTAAASMPPAAEQRRAHGGAAASSSSSSSALQKKGKWKTISRLMLERGGCRVSPQQCEDKFNDLNKRYKRLNDILGRGTSCRVVENPSLLDSLTHVTAKGKDDVRKILSSKHLFYREMCAYHNGQRIPSSACHAADVLHPPKPANDDHGQENDCDDDNNGDEDEDEDDDDEENEDGMMYIESGVEGFDADVGGIPPSELREWFKKRALQLLEERVGIEAEGFEIEKRRFKWQRFKSKKDRELERLRLENERMMLENERMLMLVRQKEFELNSNPEEASGGGYRMEVGRVQ
uniref:Myb/SANT-like DNA-binding domain-containing protein n=1 Tax=Ananas comosus var. bracteatus TaxID=296719 RepID=A0A6V7PKH9_ANACO|nr:unnamed protein product [Ananas comosus var. bracteatus]